MRWWERVLAACLRPDVTLFHEFRRPPYGGSNQFFFALRREFVRRGFRVGANLIGSGTRACLLNSYAFDVDRLRRMRHGQCRIAQRVDGPVGLYRGTDSGVDLRIWELNREFADATIFQSRYCLEAHGRLGLEFNAPVVIVNAADPAIFHAGGREQWRGGRKLRLITTSWSDNPNKGASTLQRLEQMLDWNRYEATFVGRSQVSFARIRMVPPQAPRPLAELLRSHDVFVAPSLFDPCSNALVEALTCGLPAVYARSGGHPELVGAGGLAFVEPEEIPDLLERVAHDYDRYQAAIRAPDLSEVATRYLDVLGIVTGQAPKEAPPQTSA